jgi:drug/metabolite transporter (DMT)-like permease
MSEAPSGARVAEAQVAFLAALFATRRHRLVQACFVTIYLVWGVSYAVGRIMATELPPLLSGGIRFLFSGTLLTLLVYASGLTLPTRARDWRLVVAAAVLGIAVSNGLNVLALRHVASSQVALVSASSAFWIAWTGMYGRNPAPVSKRTWLGLFVGFVGVAILVSAHGVGLHARFAWQLVVLGSALAWALATAAIRESQPDCDPLAFTAGYLLVGGLALVTVGLATGDAGRWAWSPSGLAAMVFLAIFSSTLAFLAYTYLLRHEPPARIGTYAYVNPLVAVFAGWLLLDERLNALQWAGTAVIFAGVVLVRNLRFPRLRRRTELEDAPPRDQR